MTEVFFHCSDAQHVFVAKRGKDMNLADARDHAESLVRSMISTPSEEDWRKWAMHVTDENNETVFVLPFTRLLGKQH